MRGGGPILNPPLSRPAPARWRWIVWFFCCLSVLIALPGMMSGNFLPKSAWAALSIGVGSIILSFQPSRLRRLTPAGFIWASYLAWAILSLTWAPSPRAGIERWLMFLIPTLGYILAANSRFWERRNFWIAFSLLVGLVALIGLLQYLVTDFPLDAWFQGTAVPRATLGQRNYASMYFTVTLPFLLWFWLRDKGPTALIALAAAGLVSIFLVLARTRGAWLGTMVGLGFVLLAGGGRKLRRHRGKAAISAVLLLAALAGAVLLKPAEQVREKIGKKRDWSAIVASVIDPRQRLDYWKPCLGITPFLQGAGFGNFPVLATPHIKDGSVKTLNWEVHNDYLQAFLDLGMVGFLIFSAFCLALLRLAWRKRGSGMSLAAGAAVVGLLVMQFTTFTSEKMSTLVWMAGVVALLTSESAADSPRQKQENSRSKKFFLLGSGMLLVLLAGSIVRVIAADYTLHGILEEAGSALTLREQAAREPNQERRQRLTAVWPRIRASSLDMMEDARDGMLRCLWFDANMRHIYFHQLAELFFKIKAPYQSEWLSRAALELHPADRACLSMIALGALRGGRAQEAEALLRRGLNLFGPNPYLSFFSDNLSALLEQTGRLEEAQAIRLEMEPYRVKRPSSPFPPNWTRMAGPPEKLSWEENSRETVYDLYMWKNGESHPSQPILRSLTKPEAELPDSLSPNTVYLWRVLCRGRFTSQTGPIWSFRVEETSP